MKKNRKIWIYLLYAFFSVLVLISIYYIIRVRSIESFLMLGVSVALILWFYFISDPVETRMKQGMEGKGWDKE